MFTQRIVIHSLLNPFECVMRIEQDKPRDKKFSYVKIDEGIYRYEIEPHSNMYVHFAGYITGQITARGDGSSQITAETSLTFGQFVFIWAVVVLALIYAIQPDVDSLKAALFVVLSLGLVITEFLPWLLKVDHGLGWFKALFPL